MTQPLQQHVRRSFELSRQIVALMLLFSCVMTWAGVYRFELRLLAPVLLLAIASHAVLQQIFPYWTNRDAFLLLDGFVKCLFVTICIYLLGGVEAGGIALFYVIPVAYHAVSGSRRHIFRTANMASALYAGMLALEASGVLPHRAVFGFATPPLRTYVGLALGMFAIMNAVAAVCSAVARTFGETATALEQANAALAEQNRVLEVKVAERTRSLATANHALGEKARALEQRQEDLRALIYTVTHDLKDPLANILLGADLVLGRGEDGLCTEDREELIRIVRLAEGGEGMIRDLLDLFRATAASEAAGWVDVEALVRHAVDGLRVRVEAKRVCVRVGPLPRAWGQAGKLAHVVANLLGNAVKYVRPDDGEVEVSGRLENGSALFCVRDNGVGIPAAYQARIFDLFRRVPGQTNGEPAGSGVGLAIVKRIVEAHGGAVWVESAPGTGSRFWVRLPATPAR
jgi:signal transduction histidine kinase